MTVIPTITATSSNNSSSINRHVSYDSLYINPLNDPKLDNKENVTPAVNSKKNGGGKENAAAGTKNTGPLKQQTSHFKSFSSDKVLKPSSLHNCMQMNEPDSAFWSKFRDPIGSENSNSSNNNNNSNVWDYYSDSEAAPASSWSTLPNRTLLCRPLPMDIGRCSCVIVKEETCPDGLSLGAGTLYSLYTNEGKGRQDRKLAVALCKRRNGKSIFTIAQSIRGVLSNADDSYIGAVTANLMGSKYHIWDQGLCPNSVAKQSKTLLAAVTFVPTITTWTGNYRTMKAYIPKHKSMQLKNTAQVQHINGLPKKWEERVDKVHQLFSKVPHYNKASKQYELDFRDMGRTTGGLKIKKSVKNFQLKLEENGMQTILQLGRMDKSKFVMDYRYPLTGYQAFCMCLASIDSKLCCSV